MRLVVLHHLLRLLIWGFYLAIAQHLYFLLQLRELFIAIIDAREFRLWVVVLYFNLVVLTHSYGSLHPLEAASPLHSFVKVARVVRAQGRVASVHRLPSLLPFITKSGAQSLIHGEASASYAWVKRRRLYRIGLQLSRFLELLIFWDAEPVIWVGPLPLFQISLDVFEAWYATDGQQIVVNLAIFVMVKLLLQLVMVPHSVENLICVQLAKILELLDDDLSKPDQLVLCLSLESPHFVIDFIGLISEVIHHFAHWLCVLILKHFHITINLLVEK